MRVLVGTGGTAGHVVPALAVAEVLRSRGAEVEFIGGERAEAELVPAAGYPLHTLGVSGIDRSNPLRAVRAVARVRHQSRQPQSSSRSSAIPDWPVRRLRQPPAPCLGIPRSGF